MADKIFGYDWADIQRAQQGGRLARAAVYTPVSNSITDADRELMAEHGSVAALEAAGFHGTADRFKRAVR